MPNKQKKEPSIWQKLWRTPGGMKKAEGSTGAKPKKSRPSIAEQINFGGKFRDPKKDYERNKNSY